MPSSYQKVQKHETEWLYLQYIKFNVGGRSSAKVMQYLQCSESYSFKLQHNFDFVYQALFFEVLFFGSLDLSLLPSMSKPVGDDLWIVFHARFKHFSSVVIICVAFCPKFYHRYGCCISPTELKYLEWANKNSRPILISFPSLDFHLLKTLDYLKNQATLKIQQNVEQKCRFPQGPETY